jgi:hypothetical protein
LPRKQKLLTLHPHPLGGSTKKAVDVTLREELGRRGIRHLWYWYNPPDVELWAEIPDDYYDD